MPFDRLPGANLNFSPMSNIHFAVNPGKPVFPTYEVVMRALDHLLPALDPLERKKRALAIMQLQHAPEEEALRMESQRQHILAQKAALDQLPQRQKAQALELQSREEELKTKQLQNKQKQLLLQNYQNFDTKHQEWFGAATTPDEMVDPFGNGIADAEIPS